MGRETTSVCRRYSHQILTIEGSPTRHDPCDKGALVFEITLLERDTRGIHLYDNCPLVITIRYDDKEIN